MYSICISKIKLSPPALHVGIVKCQNILILLLSHHGMGLLRIFAFGDVMISDVFLPSPSYLQQHISFRGWNYECRFSAQV